MLVQMRTMRIDTDFGQIEYFNPHPIMPKQTKAQLIEQMHAMCLRHHDIILEAQRRHYRYGFKAGMIKGFREGFDKGVELDTSVPNFKLREIEGNSSISGL